MVNSALGKNIEIKSPYNEILDALEITDEDVYENNDIKILEKDEMGRTILKEYMYNNKIYQTRYEYDENNNYINPNGIAYNSKDTSAIDNIELVTNFNSNDEQFNNIMQNVIDETSLYGKTENFTSCSLYIDCGVNEFIPHQFRIVSATDKIVTLVNPWDTSQEISVTMTDFKTGLFDLTRDEYPNISYT